MTSNRSQQALGDTTGSEESTPIDAKAVSRLLQLLVDTAAKQGRDWKLLDALLVTMTAFISERAADVLAPVDPEDPTRRLRPEFRARIDAVVDSLSDDEAAYFLGIGTRQLRRRAQQGALYFFRVGKRRRYAAWQFDERLRVVPGLREVVQTIPGRWPPDKVQRFMSGTERVLKVGDEPLAPRTWLLMGLDPTSVTALIRRDTEHDE